MSFAQVILKEDIFANVRHDTCVQNIMQLSLTYPVGQLVYNHCACNYPLQLDCLHILYLQLTCLIGPPVHNVLILNQSDGTGLTYCTYT